MCCSVLLLSCNIFSVWKPSAAYQLLKKRHFIHILSFLFLFSFSLCHKHASCLISFHSYLDSTVFLCLLSYVLHQCSVVCIVYHLFSLTHFPSSFPSPKSLYESTVSCHWLCAGVLWPCFVAIGAWKSLVMRGRNRQWEGWGDEGNYTRDQEI